MSRGDEKDGPSYRYSNTAQVRRKVRLLNFSRSSRWAYSNTSQARLTFMQEHTKSNMEGCQIRAETTGRTTRSPPAADWHLCGVCNAPALWPCTPSKPRSGRVASSQTPPCSAACSPVWGSRLRVRLAAWSMWVRGATRQPTTRRRARRKLPSPSPSFEPELVLLFAGVGIRSVMLIPSATNSLPQSLTHCLTPLRTHARMHSLTRLLTHPLTR